MTIRKILVPINGTKERSRGLQAAVPLARRFDAHIEGLHVALDPRESVAYLGDGMTGTMISQVMAAAELEQEERLKRARTTFEAVCAEQDVPVSPAAGGGSGAEGFSARFVVTSGHPEDVIARHGRMADLIVGARPQADSPGSGVLEAAIMETGRPVMVLPPSGGDWTPEAAMGGAVALAWLGSPEAARAVSFALPFLKEAARVSILHFGDEAEQTLSGAALVEYLGRHGVKVEAVQDGGQRGRRQTGEHLLARTASLGCDLLVMGAYTHNRLRQIIFGGTTRHVLENADIPVLFTH